MTPSRLGPLVLSALVVLLAACGPVGSVTTAEGHPASPTAPTTSAVVVAGLAPVPQPILPAPLRPDDGPSGEDVGGMDHAAMGHSAPAGDAAHRSRGGHADEATGSAPEPLRAVLDAYLAIQDALASDRFEGVAEHAGALEGAVAALVESPPEGDPHFWHTRPAEVAALRSGAAALREAGDLVEARVAFGRFSAPFVALVDALGVPEGYEVARFTCGMFDAVPEGGVWLQRPGVTRNPYYGGAMASCGTREGTVTSERSAGGEGRGHASGSHEDHDPEGSGTEGHGHAGH